MPPLPGRRPEMGSPGPPAAGPRIALLLSAGPGARSGARTRRTGMRACAYRDTAAGPRASRPSSWGSSASRMRGTSGGSAVPPPLPPRRRSPALRCASGPDFVVHVVSPVWAVPRQRQGWHAASHPIFLWDLTYLLSVFSSISSECWSLRPGTPGDRRPHPRGQAGVPARCCLRTGIQGWEKEAFRAEAGCVRGS